ncbi:hypothetical protein COY95_01055, partial [Candidatus Woesearchaeota archaeon CG_4_10_14_0_8_um_filter_47_5]
MKMHQGNIRVYAAKLIEPLVAFALRRISPDFSKDDVYPLATHLSADCVGHLVPLLLRRGWKTRWELASALGTDLQGIVSNAFSNAPAEPSEGNFTVPFQATRDYFASLYLGNPKSTTPGVGRQYDALLREAGVSPCQGGCGTHFFAAVRGGNVTSAIVTMVRQCALHGATGDSVYPALAAYGVGGCGGKNVGDETVDGFVITAIKDTGFLGLGRQVATIQKETPEATIIETRPYEHGYVKGPQWKLSREVTPKEQPQPWSIDFVLALISKGNNRDALRDIHTLYAERDYSGKYVTPEQA